MDSSELPTGARELTIPDSYTLPREGDSSNYTVYTEDSPDNPGLVNVIAFPANPDLPMLYSAARVKVRSRGARRSVRVELAGWVDTDGVPHDEVSELSARVRAAFRANPPGSC